MKCFALARVFRFPTVPASRRILLVVKAPTGLVASTAALADCSEEKVGGYPLPPVHLQRSNDSSVEEQQGNLGRWKRRNNSVPASRADPHPQETVHTAPPSFVLAEPQEASASVHLSLKISRGESVFYLSFSTVLDNGVIS